MTKNCSSDDKKLLRNALSDAICANVSKNDIDEACLLGSSAKRTDRLSSILRDAVKKANIAIFSGDTHVYVKELGYYVRFTWPDMSDCIYDVMLKKGVTDGNFGKMELITKRCMMAIMDRNEDIDPTIVVMRNGVYDTMDHKLHRYSPEYKTNACVRYNYSESDYPEMWHRFLDEVLPGKEMQDLLQEVVAATYVDRNLAKIETCTILLGSGANGKSVVFEVVSALLGDDNVSNFSISELIASGKKDACIAECNGKRLNYCSEIRTKEIGAGNADAFKALVSGEHMMARALYKNYFTARNIPMLMANANKLPNIDENTQAIQRRFIVIPFKAYIPYEKQDKELAANLKKELPGIFNWAMEGLKRLASHNYKISVPVESNQIISEHIKDGCTLSRYLDGLQYYCECYPQCVQECEHINATKLYNDYFQWCVDNREKYFNKKEFCDKMTELRFEKVRKSNGMAYVVYRVRTKEEILQTNLDLAVAMQKQYGYASIEVIEKASRKIVVGIVPTERYLGLPEGILLKMMMNGFLEGTYEQDGEDLKFDVLNVQRALASNGFFESISRKGSKKILRDAVNAVTNICKAFNEKMRMLGYPIRKYSSAMNMDPVDNGCIVVPIDWQFSESNARTLIKNEKQKERFSQFKNA